MSFDTDTLDKITDLVKKPAGQPRRRSKGRWPSWRRQAARPRRAHFCEEVLPAMATVRKYADDLEGWVADDLWPLPTYQEMLFIK